MARLEWEKIYSVGVQEIDAQHQELINLINDLQEALEQDNSDRAIGNIIDGVIEYTYKHFAYEEKFLEAHKYGDLKAHKKLHTEYRQKMQDMKKQFETSNMFFKPKLIRALLVWLRNHIMEVDMQYSQFLKNKKII